MNGLILLNKPFGETSFFSASKLRKIYGTKRVGHTGTLDPMATGVLPVLIGRATRLSNYLINADKRYTAKIKFGISTDTLDITGSIISTAECNIKKEQLEEILPKFRGIINQVPPMYSAIKKDGVRLYELARKGIETERPERSVEIKSIEILRQTEKNEFLVDVLCSKGTYIRSLAEDLGKALGVGACLTALTRTETAGFKLEDCLSFEEISKNPEASLLPADKAIGQFSNVYVTENQKNRFLHGGELSLERLTVPYSEHDFYKVYYKDLFLGLAEKKDDSLKVKCIITE